MKVTFSAALKKSELSLPITLWCNENGVTIRPPSRQSYFLGLEGSDDSHQGAKSHLFIKNYTHEDLQRVLPLIMWDYYSGDYSLQMFFRLRTSAESFIKKHNFHRKREKVSDQSNDVLLLTDFLDATEKNFRQFSLEERLKKILPIIQKHQIISFLNVLYPPFSSFYKIESTNLLASSEFVLPILNDGQLYGLLVANVNASIDRSFAEYYLFKLCELLSLSYKITYMMPLQHMLKENEMSQTMPHLVISSDGDIIFSNKEFRALMLTPKKILEYKQDDTIEYLGNFYRIEKSEYQLDGDTYNEILFQIEDKNLNASRLVPSSKDLGIITSSIAHELSNPLAGILAAITLLLLDVRDEESLHTLEEMELVAKRCQSLVSIFLGFSRKDPLLNSTFELKKILDQALHLLHFRMVESKTVVEFYYEKQSVYGANLNDSILIMVIYLIVSEMMTSMSHNRLITQDSIHSMSLKIFVREDSDFLHFNCESFLELKHIKPTKLLVHLLDLLGLVYEFKGGELRLRRNNFPS